MGNGSSKLDKALAEGNTGDERYYGLENFGNTCYCNSVLQALYHCRPFRERVVQYAQELPKDSPETLLGCLAELFLQISVNKKKTGVLAPKKFVARLKRDNELFSGYMHQDAHEFLNYVLNQSSEILEDTIKQACKARTGRPPPIDLPINTWIHEIFQGKLVNETRCLHCETVTCREEVFMDLSLEIEQNSSLTSCLRNFSAMETLNCDDKFFCDHCCCLQEAQKRMLIKEAPPCLILHLKRFKYVESQGRMRKLMYRVVFPLELKLSNTTADAFGADTTYSLRAVVVHVGSGPHHGHYISLIKSFNQWVFFDDENVELITESQVQTTFGSTQENMQSNNMDHGYILFYERA
mmetsp:Transcript_4642/g.8008  ORF Transcript_4642/g.8008 Transcript_4642/m.8008 type:complete len:352 (-) Transcript_4642:104-1159(-)